MQLGVVLNSHITNGSQQGERNVGKLDVVDEGDTVGDASDVLSREGGEFRVGVEFERLSDGLETRNHKALDVGELDLSSSGELGHVDFHVVSVASNTEESGDVGEIRIESSQLVVVGDSKAVNTVDVETAQIIEESIGNDDVGGLGDTRSAKSQGAQLGELDHVQFVQGLERLHVNRAQELEALKLKVASNRLDGRAGDGDELGGVVDDEITSDRLGSLEAQAAGHGRINGDAGIDDIASNDGSRLSNLDVLGTGGDGCG